MNFFISEITGTWCSIILWSVYKLETSLLNSSSSGASQNTFISGIWLFTHLFYWQTKVLGLKTELFSFSTTADHSKLLNTKIITSTLNSASKDSANHPHMLHMTMTWKDKEAQPWYSWKVLTQKSQTDFSQKLKNYPQVSSSWRVASFPIKNDKLSQSVPEFIRLPEQYGNILYTG